MGCTRRNWHVIGNESIAAVGIVVVLPGIKQTPVPLELQKDHCKGLGIVLGAHVTRNVEWGTSIYYDISPLEWLTYLPPPRP